MLSFAGRTVVITGGGGALGRAYALEFAKRGAQLLINDVGAGSVTGTGGDTSQTAAANVVAEITSRGGKAVANYSNVATEGNEIIESALRAFKRVDVLVNNAGILRDKSFHKLEKSDWDSVLQVHLEGTFSLCRAVWPHMQANNYGRIINIGSGAGLYGNFGQANYAAAKMGCVGLTHTLAKEGAKHNIHVNCVVPIGASRMTATVLPPSMLALLEPDHIAPLVSLLCHESCALNGDIFEVGGGWYSQVKLQRSAGASLGSSGHFASAEEIMENLSSIQDFSFGATYPTTAADALRDMMAASNSGVRPTPTPIPTPIPTTPPSSSPPGSSFNSAGSPPVLQSDALFLALGDHLNSAPPSSEPPLVRGLVEFAMEEDGSGKVLKRWILDGKRVGAPSISLLGPSESPPSKPSCSISLSDATFLQLTRGELSTEWAYARGLLKVQGSMGVALKMKPILELAGKLGAAEKK